MDWMRAWYVRLAATVRARKPPCRSIGGGSPDWPGYAIIQKALFGTVKEREPAAGCGNCPTDADYPGGASHDFGAPAPQPDTTGRSSRRRGGGDRRAPRFDHDGPCAGGGLYGHHALRRG